MLDSNASPFNGSTQHNNAMKKTSSHYIINARGPDDVFHISDGYATRINRAYLKNNPQRPIDLCQRTNGYRAYCVAYKKDPLKGVDK